MGKAQTSSQMVINTVGHTRWEDLMALEHILGKMEATMKELLKMDLKKEKANGRNLQCLIHKRILEKNK